MQRSLPSEHCLRFFQLCLCGLSDSDRKGACRELVGVLLNSEPAVPGAPPDHQATPDRHPQVFQPLLTLTQLKHSATAIGHPCWRDPTRDPQVSPQANSLRQQGRGRGSLRKPLPSIFPCDKTQGKWSILVFVLFCFFLVFFSL